MHSVATATLPAPAALLDLLPGAVCVVDVEGTLLFVNAAFQRVLGYAPAEVVGRSMFELVLPDDREATARQAERVMDGQIQRHFRNRYIHKDGHAVDIQWSARWLPEYGVRIGVGHDISELRRAELELEHRANHDPLTGLANRDRLLRELEGAIARATVGGGGLALLYVDLDGFKRVNDRGGHRAGDLLLHEVAQRMHSAVRAQDVVARVGGDEFVVLLPECRDVEAARRVAESLRLRLAAPCKLPAGLFQLDASIGVACFPDDGVDADTLLARADQAMYAAKRTRERRPSLAGGREQR